MDPSQNDYADTPSAAYSVRLFHIAMESTPLEWNETNHRLDPVKFTIDTNLPRLKKKGDLFAGLLDKKIAANNSKIISKL